ncbi:uridine kinase family protein [Nocardioides acrostichi]|uniref:ATP-binding protein n=1 Tax=Nocardioides acrostichi TaxID=2784339 RepID=A0A930Y793_9ACTN|nr:ATP-binding protein [Nocardioides acrostichi]MBF4161797.1 ATP-binding protein [Nocardioides acrostichi]
MPGPARVVVLAGPSGSGKSRLAARLGLPVLRLDDFYRDGDTSVDWDHPDSWLLDDAVTCLLALCREGRAEVPVYDIGASARTGWQTFDLGGHDRFVAEGIFAPLVVAPMQDAGLLAGAFCVRRTAFVTFWLRLARDLREHRKPPALLVRRGLALARAQGAVVQDAVSHGCTPLTPGQVVARLR